MKNKYIFLLAVIALLSGCASDNSSNAEKPQEEALGTTEYIISETETETETDISQASEDTEAETDTETSTTEHTPETSNKDISNTTDDKSTAEKNEPGLIGNVAARIIAAYIVNDAVNEVKKEMEENPEEFKAEMQKLYNRTTTEEKCEIVMDAFINRDNTTLKELFCDKITQTHDLDAEFNKALELINGNIVSYSERSVELAASTGGSSWENGELVDDYIDPRIEEVVTDTGNEYWIGFYSKKIYAEDKTLVGIQYINVYDCAAEEKYMIGEYIK